MIIHDGEMPLGKFRTRWEDVIKKDVELLGRGRFEIKIKINELKSMEDVMVLWDFEARWGEGKKC